MSELPYEVVARTLESLDKASLKNARLINRLWSVVGAKYLFDRVFISPHQPNIDIFEAITQHPILAKYVKELHYDTVFFPSCISERVYAVKVSQETRINPVHISGCHDESDPYKRQFLTYLDSKATRPSLEDRTTIAWQNFPFMQEGYCKYLALEKDQKSLLESDHFKKVIVKGLRKLDRLETLVVRDSWCADIDTNRSEDFVGVRKPVVRSPYQSAKRKQGSPLARSWDHFYLQPRHSWTYLDKNETAQVSVAFQHVISSLLGAQRPVQLLRTQDIPKNTFSLDTASSNIVSNDRHAFLAGLERLEVSLPCSYVCNGEINDSLKATLAQACNLKYLTLIISNGLYMGHVSPVSANEIWSQLTDCHIKGLEFETKEFLRLITIQMPRLQHLTLDFITLTDSMWLSVFEYLRILNRLSSLTIARQGLQSLEGARSYSADCFWPSGKFDSDKEKFMSIENYVIDWPSKPDLRHPNLLPKFEDGNCLEYALDMLEDCELSPGDQILGDFGLRLNEYVVGLGYSRIAERYPKWFQFNADRS